MNVSISRGIVSVIGADLRIEGNITTNGDVIVLGALTGTVTAHKLTVEKGGTIDGDAKAEIVVINGKFSGNLASGSVSLGRTASVNADVTYVSMEMQTGGVLRGQVRHVDSINARIANGETAAPVLELIRPAPGAA